MRAWRKERPRRISRLSNRADLILELRKKVERILGDGLSIKITIDLLERPIATIEELRFTLSEHRDRSQRMIMLIDSCPRCGAETVVIINSLADLGQLFESEKKTSLVLCN